MDHLTLTHDNQGWWIIDPADPEPIGPYETRREADEDRRGLERFARLGERKGFVTH